MLQFPRHLDTGPVVVLFEVSMFISERGGGATHRVKMLIHEAAKLIRFEMFLKEGMGSHI